MVLNGYYSRQGSQNGWQDGHGHGDGQVGNKGGQDIQQDGQVGCQNVNWLLGIARMLFILLSHDHYNGKENWSSRGLTIYISNFIITIQNQQ